jgi:Tfp pilus assembly protein PilP
MRAFAILFAPLVFLLLSSCSLLLDYDLHTVVPQASTRVDAELVSLTVVEAPSDQRTGTTFRLTD